jgi:hypothetical protein
VVKKCDALGRCAALLSRNSITGGIKAEVFPKLKKKN